MIGLGIAAGVAAVILGSSALTGADWTDAENLDGGRVQSGELSLLNGDGTNQVNAFAFTELAGEDLGPTDHAQAPLVLSNGGTADLRYRLLEVTQSAGEPMLLTASVVPTRTDCPTGVNAADPARATELFTGSVSEAQTAWRALAVPGAEALCLRVGPDPDGEPGAVDDSRLVFRFAAEST